MSKQSQNIPLGNQK